MSFSHSFSRRRFLSFASAACLLAPAAWAFQWHGTALGASARIILDHPDAERITERALAEITRLENIFSLYRDHSEITRLNADGHLDAPSFELLDCLAIARQAHRVTGGRFDPTVQPLWRVLADAHVAGHPPKAAQLAAARRSIGFEKLHFDSASVELAAGQQLTLNGIAQGYIADRIALLMRAEGVEDVLIDTGEILAMGAPKGSDAWPVTIVGEVEARALSGRALATSAPFGMMIDAAGQVGHILDPRSGTALVTDIRQVSVSAPHAALADALSTGLCAAKDVTEARHLLRNVKDAILESVQTSADAI
ncbi:FAD:protein FMN transferase [Pseudooceanicola sp.]|uniref:FAD:protein FMN transferase n=1 Tax=Pseudooceanicola sp. TaxID=1914328 RepID=UPI002617A8CA|nr:FAD:protein FMN transferase [Pseudooceanicola sp.]MDF1856044.1 FAD:protein FMN transferase [Pseudooceanicola sp.]